jgi:predicted enzyme related to lactoylglutathione lyase
LGLPLLFRVPQQPMAFVQCGQTRLYLGVPEDEAFRSRPVIYLTVDDIHTTYEDILANGVEFVDEPHVVHRAGSMELWMAFCRDPDGNAVAIMQERNAA